MAPLGSVYYFQGGTAYYLLPAPAGYWLPNGRCEVFREACDEDDATCEASEDACKVLPDSGGDCDTPAVNTAVSPSVTCQVLSHRNHVLLT